MDGKIVYADGREEILKYGITEIAENAYYKNKDIVSMVLPSSVKSIGAHAFVGCSLTSILFSNGLITIGKDAFSGAKSLESIEIPDGVTKIEDWTFDHCIAMQNVKIPESVVSIGYWAFDNCTALKDVYYSGSKEDWRKISVSMFNDDLLNANIHFNYSPKTDARRTPKAEVEAKAIAEARAKADALAKAQAEAKAKAEAEAKAAAEAKAKAEAELRVFAEARIKAEEEARKAAEARALSDRKLKEQIEARIAAEKRAQEEEKAKIEAEKRAEEAVKARIEAEEKAEIAEKERIEAEALLAQFLEELQKGKLEENSKKLELSGFETKNVPLAVQALLSGKIVYANGEEEDIPHNKMEIASYEYARKDVKEVILPSRVTAIGCDAFYRCESLVSIKIPVSVTEIGDGAFAACENLLDIYYAGAQSEWEKINIGKDNKKLSGVFGRATVHYNCK